MPPKGSRALNEKNSFLGVFQNNKKEINGMDKIIFEQKEVMEAKKIELKRINEELQDISREISYFSGEINKKLRKLLHHIGAINTNKGTMVIHFKFTVFKG